MYYPIFSKDLEDLNNIKVAVIGKIIKKNVYRKFIDITLLDPFGYIPIRSFDPLEIEEFETLLVLGKIKEFRGKKYLYLKYYAKLSEEEEIFWRRKHLNMYKKFINKIKKVRTERESNEEIEIVENPKKAILKAIEILDKGNGVSIEEIIRYTKLDKNTVERIIEDLLISGEVYEASLGRLKILK